MDYQGNGYILSAFILNFDNIKGISYLWVIEPSSRNNRQTSESLDLFYVISIGNSYYHLCSLIKNVKVVWSICYYMISGAFGSPMFPKGTSSQIERFWKFCLCNVQETLHALIWGMICFPRRNNLLFFWTFCFTWCFSEEASLAPRL